MACFQAVERKPQQQTLSIRISETLREFLERSKHVMSGGGRGESVSTSDVAKMLLESAKEDRLDFRLEVAELQQDPTAALVAIRRKWQGRQPLTRSEWVFLGQYVQVATEDLKENAAPPPAHSFVAIFEAFLAVRSLRTDRGVELDRYYLGNLGGLAGGGFNQRQLDPELVQRTVTGLVKGLRHNPGGSKPLAAGRCLYVALRDEDISELVALNEALEPHLPALFRLAARGHWMRERRPLRSLRDRPAVVGSVPLVARGGIKLSGSISSEGEVSLAFSLEQKNVVYPLGYFPEIREFAAMLDQMKSGETWSGVHFHGYTVSDSDSASVPQFAFYRYRDLVVLGFSIEEWQHLRELVAAALTSPKLRPFWEELELVYGEL
jgi:hypothetical protein